MQCHPNIVSRQVNSLLAKTLQIRKKASKNSYTWADSLFRDDKISAPVLHTLKAILACSALAQPTIQQINEARTRSASRKFAQSDAVGERTVRRHVVILEELGLITVARTRDKRRNSRNSYTVNVPAQELSCRSEDTMSASLTLATSHNINNTKSDNLKGKVITKLDFGFNDLQLAILATMMKWRTTRWVACGWIRKYTVDELQGGIDYMDRKNIDHDNRGGYMRAILKGLDERKQAMAEKKNPKANMMIPGLMATEMLLNRMENHTRSDRETAKAELQKLKGLIKK